MARNGKTTVPNGQGVDGKAGPAEDAASGGVPGGTDTARAAVSGSLAAAHDIVDWVMQLQRQQTKLLGEWRQALESAQPEIEQAADLQALVTATTKLTQRQTALAVQQVGEVMAAWMGSETALANRFRSEAAGLMQKMLPVGVLPAAGAGVSDTSPLAQIGRMQDQWLAMTQRWIDTAGAAAPH